MGLGSPHVSRQTYGVLEFFLAYKPSRKCKKIVAREGMPKAKKSVSS